MGNCIYKQLVFDCPIAYAHVKVVRNENGDFYGVKIIDVNNSFEVLFEIENFFIKDKYIRNFISKEHELKFYEHLMKSKDGKYSVTKYLQNKNCNLNVEIYNQEIDEYHIRINKISSDKYKISELLRKSPFMAWIKDRNGNYIDVNNTFLEMADMSYGEIIGKTDGDIWDEENVKKFSIQDLETIRTNKLFNSEDCIKTKKKVYNLDTCKWQYM